jgi:hypothetical protein
VSYHVQILLPLQDNDGQPQPPSLFRALEAELTTVFGGVTAYTQSPARGRWVEPGGEVSKDEIVLIEVSTEEIDPIWWATLRKRLADEFRQETIVIRATEIELL